MDINQYNINIRPVEVDYSMGKFNIFSIAHIKDKYDHCYFYYYVK